MPITVSAVRLERGWSRCCERSRPRLSRLQSVILYQERSTWLQAAQHFSPAASALPIHKTIPRRLPARQDSPYGEAPHQPPRAVVEPLAGRDGRCSGINGSVASAVTCTGVTATVGTAGTAHSTGFDEVAEAVRQTVLAAQVAGAVVALDVEVGDAVKTGQVPERIDSRAANQGTAASDVQVMAARASLDMATKDLERQKQLFQKSYINQMCAESRRIAIQIDSSASGSAIGPRRRHAHAHAARIFHGQGALRRYRVRGARRIG